MTDDGDEELNEPRPDSQLCDAPGCDRLATGEFDYCQVHRNEDVEGAETAQDEPIDEASEGVDRVLGVDRTESPGDEADR